MELDNLNGIIPKGVDATKVYVMAGNGTSVPVRDLKRLYKEYPNYGSVSGWQKKSADVDTDNYHYVVHWYENRGRTPCDEIKLKGVK